MGGSALKTEVSRFGRTQGKVILDTLRPHLDKMFKHWAVTKSVREKTDFGDMDVICAEPITDFAKYIQEVMEPIEVVRNSNVISLEFSGIQVDLIIVPPTEYAWAYYYYSNNDLGNLIGRIANNIGFKFGGQGLFYEFRRDSGNFAKDLLITRDVRRAISFLGFSQFQHSFETFEDMYKYVMTSALADPMMFPLENRNHEGRHRDKKRVVYMNFLTWLQDHYDMGILGRVNHNQLVHLTRAKQLFLLFQADFRDAEDEYVEYARKKERFNGKIVMDVTGLRGEDLGKFIKAFKSNINFVNWINDPNVDMRSQIKRIYENYYQPIVEVTVTEDGSAEVATTEVLSNAG